MTRRIEFLDEAEKDVVNIVYSIFVVTDPVR